MTTYEEAALSRLSPDHAAKVYWLSPDGEGAIPPYWYWHADTENPRFFSDYRFKSRNTDTQCFMTTEDGSRCGISAAQPLFDVEEPVYINPSLAAIAVCHIHRAQLEWAIHETTVSGRSNGSSPSLLARIVIPAEEERVRDAKAHREQVEREIAEVVQARLSAPLYTPKGAIAS